MKKPPDPDKHFNPTRTSLEDIFRATMEVSENKIYAVDPNFHFSYFNPGYAQLVENLYGAEPRLDASPLDYTAGEAESAQLAGYLKQALNGQTIQVENSFDSVASDRYFKTTFHPIKDHKGEISGVTVIITDLTACQQAELTQAQARLAAIVESSDDAIFSKTLDGIVLSWNQGATRLYGYTAEEMIGQPVSRLLPPNHPDELPMLLAKLSQGEQILHYEAVRRGKDGADIAVDLTISPVKDIAGNIIAASTIARDISKHKQLEGELEKANRRISTILESINDGFYALDAQERFTYVNSKIEELWGKQAKDLIGRCIWDVFPQMVGSPPYQHLRRALAEQIPVEFETHSVYIHQWVAVSVYPADGGISVYFRDISKQKRAEDGLRQSEARFKAFMDNSPAGSWITDLEGKFVYLSQPYGRTYGLDIDTTPGKNVFEVFPQEMAEKFLANLQQTNATGQPVSEVEPFLRPDGSAGYAMVYRFPLPDLAGQKLVGGIALDITERILTEQELRLSEERFLTVAQNSRDVIWIMNLNGQFTYVSPSVEQLRGYTVEEVLRQGMGEALTPASAQVALEGFQNSLEAAARGEATQALHQLEQPRKDGSTVWTEVSSTTIMDANGNLSGFLGISRDITDRRQMEQALTDANRRIVAILESIGDAFYALDAQECFTYVNTKLLELTGLNREELIGRPFSELVYKVMTPAFYQAVHQSLTDQVQQEFEFFSTFFARWFSCSIYPAGGGVSVYLHDVTARKETEEALRRSEKRFQIFMENSPALVYMIDIDGVYRYLNQAFIRMVGLPEGQNTPKTAFDLFPVEMAEKYRANNQIVFATGKAIEVVETYVRADGSIGYVITNKFPLLGASEPPLIGAVSVDITERVLVQEALARREEEFRALVENSPDLVVRTDLELRCLYANPAMARIGMISVEEMIGKTGYELGVYQGAWETWVDLKNKVLETGLPQVAEYEMPNPSGKNYYLQTRMVPEFNQGKLETLLVITRDLSELKQAQDEIIDQERFKALFELSPDAVCLMDNLSRIISCNRALEILTACPRSQLLGQPATELQLITTDQLVEITNHTSLTWEPLSLETVIRHPGGAERTIELRVQRVMMKGQAHFLCTIRDISSRKQLEIELRQALEKQIELVELKDRFISTTSHEFRTPLSVIQTAGDALSMYIDKMTPEQIQYRVAKIRAQINHVVKLLDDVLIYSRLQDGQTPFQQLENDLAAFSQKIIQELIEVDRGKHQIVLKLPSEPLKASFSELYMQKIINNLMSNALKFSPAGSTVEFELGEKSDQIVIKVTDQGQGIPATEQVKIFEPFHRAENAINIQGTGLGLAIVRDAVKLHGGSISVSSQEGQGTSFIVTLPNTP